MDNTPTWFLIIQTIALLASVVASFFIIKTFYVYKGQLEKMGKQHEAMEKSLAEMHEANQGDKLFSLLQYMLEEKMEQARIRILDLADKMTPYSEWVPDDHVAAKIVCQRMNVAGLMASRGMIPASVFYESWYYSIPTCNDILRQYIEEQRSKGKRGPEYWQYFDWMATQVRLMMQSKTPTSKEMHGSRGSTVS